jgi:hypothetical protein
VVDSESKRKVVKLLAKQAAAKKMEVDGEAPARKKKRSAVAIKPKVRAQASPAGRRRHAAVGAGALARAQPRGLLGGSARLTRNCAAAGQGGQGRGGAQG